jgi:amino acid adenylation domain-containing protein
MNPSYLVHHFLEHSAKRFPDKTALVCGEERLTYGQVNAKANRLARHLIASGLRRKDRVAIFLDTSLEAVISVFGALKAGGIFLMLSPTMKAKKLSYILKDSGARCMVTHSAKAQIAIEALADAPELEHVVWAGSNPGRPGNPKMQYVTWEEAINPEAGLQDLDTPCIDVDLATIIYTSGSTGEPKGVMSAHCNVVAAARSITQYLGNTENDIVMNALPLSFDYGLYQVLMAFLYGGTVVLEKSFLFPVKVLEIVVAERVTGFPMVPTMVALLLQMENLSKFDFSSLRYITNTAAALPAACIRKLQSLFPHVTIFSMYGLTECKRVSYLPPDQLDKRPDSVGIPIPNEEVFVVDKNGKEVPDGVVGELVIRGSNVMQGYWNSPAETSKRFKPGSYPGERLLYSGDYFKRDLDGYLYFVARKDDMIKTKGERVSPKEIENVLCELEGIVEAAVIGVPDPILGQAIKAFIVIDPKVEITEKKVMSYCSKNLEPFMMPKSIEIKDAFPRTTTGKIDKKLLS